MLPEFLIVGAPKCGTTSLADALSQHPDLFIPERKELGFFDKNWERGMTWLAQYFEQARSEQLRGEATPDYFATPLAAERIAAHESGVQVDRAGTRPRSTRALALLVSSQHWARTSLVRSSGR